VSSPLQLIPSRDLAILLPLLIEAEENQWRTEEAIKDAANVAYLFSVEGAIVGAAVMHWDADESELLYIQTEKEYRGKGYGKAGVAALLAEAQARGVKSVIVGTANASLDNIAFYQKCGFRMDSIRKDFFDYLARPLYSHGIQMRDMIVFRYEVPTA
jgi:ribosomal protein S18 acetylase RimI-like enzyme